MAINVLKKNQLNERMILLLVLWGLIFTQWPTTAFAQQATSESRKAAITEEKKKIKTYPFGDPDPTSILGYRYREQETVYPYFKYDGYSHTAKVQDWTVVEMENPYIKLSVLPGAGGKVKGAIEKSTGKEFIYDNDAMKFRNIALRGPWTSGGIEFNFGASHTPQTAEHVDYLIKNNTDGSVSCIVGALDLASRTEWRVNIKLPRDKAYFETNCFYYNATPIDQTNWVWLTAAAKTKGNLEIISPGNKYLGHDGKSFSWPIDDRGRNLSFYKNDNFGGNKSFHVIGSNKEYFAGYWHDDNFGFGHWSPYESTPGKKVWFWSQARSGAIWDSLLNDHKGQYMEYQVGRFLAQSEIESGLNTPFNLPAIGPQTADLWQDLWFPIKNIGGVKATSKFAVLNVTQDERKCIINVFALAAMNTELLVESGDQVLYRTPLKLAPAEIFNKELNISGKRDHLVIRTIDGKLYYNSDSDDYIIDRPSKKPDDYQISPVEKNYFNAIEYYNSRHFTQAFDLLQKVLKQGPNHFNALVALSELFYRRGQYAEGKALILKAIQNKYYDPSANYKLGILSVKLRDLRGAEVAFRWAAQSMEFRSSAYVQIADIAVRDLNYEKAMEYADKALSVGKYNINAYKTKAIAQRSLKMQQQEQATLDEILEIDPLNHFARFEKYLLSGKESDLQNFKGMIRNSNPHQTYLEIASYYLNLGKTDNAIKVLSFSPQNPMVSYWLAFLKREINQAESEMHLKQAIGASPELVFPFRLEELEILEWAKTKNDAWQTKYYLGLIYWYFGQFEKSEKNFEVCGNLPDYYGFYLNRSKFSEIHLGTSRKDDLLRAIELNSSEWRGYHELINLYIKMKAFVKAEEISERAFKKFEGNYIIGLDYANALFKTDKFKESLVVLSHLNVFPYENAVEGRRIFEKNLISLSLHNLRNGKIKEALSLLEKSKEYPENLGVGMPYDPDCRLQNFLTGILYEMQGNINGSKQKMEEVYLYSSDQKQNDNGFQYLGAVAARMIGKEAEGLSLIEEAFAQSKSPIASWELMKFKGDEVQARKLAEEISNNDHFNLMLRILEMQK